MPNIFEYQDFRKYLEAYYQEKKAVSKSFSYRSLSKAAGSSSFLYHVIEEKEFDKNSLTKLSNALGHSAGKAIISKTWFFNQAKQSLKKHITITELSVRKPSTSKLLTVTASNITKTGITA